MVIADGEFVAVVLARLAKSRSVFHSEADLQLAFAMTLASVAPTAGVRLEARPWGKDKNWALDVECFDGGERIAIEMKYLVREFEDSIDGEQFVLRTQSGHDLRRYDTVKDLFRVEELVTQHGFTGGHVVVLSNDPAYWKEPTRRSTLDDAFRIHDGAALEGERAWNLSAGGRTADAPPPGTINGREPSLALRGRYCVEWADYSEVKGKKNGLFKSLVLSCDARGLSIT